MPDYLEKLIKNAREKRQEVTDDTKCLKAVEMAEAQLNELEESGAISSKSFTL